MSTLNSLKAFFNLCRISNLPTVWTNVLAAIVISGGEFSWSSFLVLSLSMSLLYSGGMCLNDICDADIDRIKKPFRPIPSGRVSIKNAYIFTIALFVIALALLLIVPYKRSFYTGFFLLALIIIYDVFHKAQPLSVILMAACRMMVFMVSAIASTGTAGFFTAIAGSLQFVYTMIISIAARCENKRKERFSFPVIPVMIVCISLLDGIVMAVLVSPAWLVAGISGAVLTQFGQKYIRGD